MHAEQFVEAIREHVMRSTTEDTLTVLRRPPGRRPAADIVALSGWFNALSDQDRQMVGKLLDLAARTAVFGFLAVLDGSRKIDGEAAPGDYFELRHVHADGDTVLAGPRGEPLHELL